MSNIFKHIGLIALMCFCFYLTDKTALVVKNNDDIMIKIKEEYKNYEHKSVDAKIIEDTIIPGTCSSIVNKEKSYYEMTKIGKYNSNLYVFEYTKPKISITNNTDKYIISDNNQAKKIYIFIELTSTNYNEILNNNYQYYNFYTTSDFFLNNKNIIEKLVNKNNSVLITKTNFTNLKKINSDYNNILDKNISCYFETKDSEYINNCSLIKSKSIYVTNNYNNNYLLKLKEKIKRGIFISVTFNNYQKEKKMIEKYIKTKGLKLATIDNNIDEC